MKLLDRMNNMLLPTIFKFSIYLNEDIKISKCRNCDGVFKKIASWQIFCCNDCSEDWIIEKGSMSLIFSSFKNILINKDIEKHKALLDEHL